MVTLRFVAAHVCVTDAVGEPILEPGLHREVRAYLDVGARSYTFARGDRTCTVDSAGGVRLGTGVGCPTWSGAPPAITGRIPSPYYELRFTGAAAVGTDPDGRLLVTVDDDVAHSLGADQGIVALLGGGAEDVTVEGEGLHATRPVTTVPCA